MCNLPSTEQYLLRDGGRRLYLESPRLRKKRLQVYVCVRVWFECCLYACLYTSVSKTDRAIGTGRQDVSWWVKEAIQ